MCDALRGMLTGFVLRLRGAHSRRWDVQNLSQVSGSFWPDSTGRHNRLAESFSGAFSSIHNDAKKQLDIGSLVLEFVFILRQGHGGFGPAICL